MWKALKSQHDELLRMNIRAFIFAFAQSFNHHTILRATCPNPLKFLCTRSAFTFLLLMERFALSEKKSLRSIFLPFQQFSLIRCEVRTILVILMTIFLWVNFILVSNVYCVIFMFVFVLCVWIFLVEKVSLSLLLSFTEGGWIFFHSFQFSLIAFFEVTLMISIQSFASTSLTWNKTRPKTVAQVDGNFKVAFFGSFKFFCS